MEAGWLRFQFLQHCPLGIPQPARRHMGHVAEVDGFAAVARRQQHLDRLAAQLAALLAALRGLRAAKIPVDLDFFTVDENAKLT